MSRRNARRAGVADRIQSPSEGVKAAMRRLKRYGRGRVDISPSRTLKFLHRAERERRIAPRGTLNEP